MSHKVIAAVYQSRLERGVRPLAATLAFFANDDGCEIRPGVKRLMQALGRTERTVREGLQVLVETGVLVRDGYARHTRRFKFDLDRLATYSPSTPTRAARRATREPCAVPQGSKRETLRRGAGNPAPFRREPCAVAPETLRRSAAQVLGTSTDHVPDPQDHHDPQEHRTAPSARHTPTDNSRAKSREPAADGNRAVIEALAFQILKQHITEGVTLSDSDFVELVKQACAERHIDYGRHPDVPHNVVHLACERARHWEAWARAAGHLPRTKPTNPDGADGGSPDGGDHGVAVSKRQAPATRRS
jgi:hypothetical protein